MLDVLVEMVLWRQMARAEGVWEQEGGGIPGREHRAFGAVCSGVPQVLVGRLGVLARTSCSEASVSYHQIPIRDVYAGALAVCPAFDEPYEIVWGFFGGQK